MKKWFDFSLLAALALLGMTTTANATDQKVSAQTVAQIQDSFKADKGKLLGQKATVKGLYLNGNATMSGSSKSYNIVVVDAKGKLSPSITCDLSQEAKGLRQYDKVTIEGTVSESFGAASLTSCSVKKDM